MQKINSILTQIPGWLVTVCVALIVSYATIQLKVNTLETRNSVIQERINQLDANKALQFSAPANATTPVTAVFAFDVALGIEALSYTVDAKSITEQYYKIVEQGTGTVVP